MSAEPISDEALASMRHTHRERPFDGGTSYCDECDGTNWPCDIAALLARLDAEARRARELEAQVADWREVLAEVAFRKDEDGVGFCDWEQIRTRAALARYPKESP